MSDRDALIRTICEHPFDDTPRLVLADWLDDHGNHEEHDYAEFIRVQCDHRRDQARELILWMAIKLIGEKDWEKYYWKTSLRMIGRNDVILDARRGFVDTVYAPMAVLMGERCGNQCELVEGFRKRRYQVYEEHGPYESGWVRCPRCNGTGRTLGILKDLFSQHPITRVVVTDKSPLMSDRAPDRIEYYWIKSDSPTILWEMPPELYRRMANRFPTEDDAIDALSAAVVAHGRELVDLPALTATGHTATSVQGS